MQIEPRIAHLDMDAYFASVEQLRYPDLVGKAVVIGGSEQHQPTKLPDGSYRYARLRDYKGRGVVTTATYAARALGIFSAMGMMHAARLAPDAVLLPVDFARYRYYSQLFKNTVRGIAPLVEDRGIDEIYIDLSDVQGAVIDIAQRLKNAVLAATGLTCSIAVAPNKLLAKIGSELQKPDGLTILTEADIPTKIWTLPVGKVNGIGPKAKEKLTQLGIQTIGELAATDVAVLIKTFGTATGNWMARAAQGIDASPVVIYSEPKSMSRETTFDVDLEPVRQRHQIDSELHLLCQQVASDLKRKEYLGKTISLKLRFTGFVTVTRNVTINDYTDDAGTIYYAVSECLRRVTLDTAIRLLGVRVGTLVKAKNTPIQVPLFDGYV